MRNDFYQPGDNSGFQYDKYSNTSRDKNLQAYLAKGKGRDEDLIIEENTIYEIDRECYERLKKKKKK